VDSLCGAPWRELPERYGPWQAAHRRFARWRRDGTWVRVLALLLLLRADPEGLLDYA
jgi:transposase